MKNRTQIFSSLALALTIGLTAVPGLAIMPAYDCTSDADCDPGAVCQKDQWTNGCAASLDGAPVDCDASPQQAERGICYTPEPQCTSDAECGEYLTCNEENSNVCTGSSSGETTCTDVPSEFYCGVSQTTCSTDADCPREFQCVEGATACLLIDRDCPIDEPDCNACAPAQMECQPSSIDCTSDSECPAEWSCFDSNSSDCSEGGGAQDVVEPGSLPQDPDTPDDLTANDAASSNDDSGSGEDTMPAPDGDVRELPEPVDIGDACVTRERVGKCYPDAWSGESVDPESGFTADGSGSLDSDTEQTNGSLPPQGTPEESDDMGVESGAGCSVSATGSPSSGAWIFGLLFLVPGLRRRFRSLSRS